MTDTSANEPTRLVVNTNMGLTNVVDIESSKSIINDTLDKCIEILTQHCGPYAKYAMLINGYTAGEKFEPSVFTRDGIRILSAVEFVSPIERYIQDLLTYVGSRVDNYAKDGTTTSMLVTAIFIRKLLNHYNYEEGSPVAIAKEINVFFKELKDNIENCKTTVEKLAASIKGSEADESDLVHAASIVAYMQALSSSGGNVQLAQCLREIFANSPTLSWDFISYQNNPKESDVPYSVYTPEYDVKFKCSLATSSVAIFNKGLGTEYEMEDVRCIIYSGGLIQGAMDLLHIMQYVNEYPSDKPLMIISPSIDPGMVRDIDKLNNNRVVPIVLWQYLTDMRIRNSGLDFELKLTNAVCGCEPFEARSNLMARMSDEYTFVAKRVHFFGGYLHIYDTAPVEEGTCIHPYYLHKDKATSYYNDLREAIQVQLDLYEHNARSDMQLRNYLIETLNRMACIHRPTLYLGGTVHDQVANADVVQDVLGAVMSSLKHGFYINGIWSFLDTISGISEKLKDSNVYLALRDSTRAVWDLLYQDSVDYYHPLDGDNYFNILYGESDSGSSFISNMDDCAENNNYPILHPIGIYTELLKRINELAIKFALTNKIIVRGGVVVPKEDE